jgi:hypothetical protein
MAQAARAKAAVLRELRQKLLAEEKSLNHARVEAQDKYRELAIERAVLAGHPSQPTDARAAGGGEEDAELMQARRAAFELKERDYYQRERQLAARERRLAEGQVELQERVRSSVEQWRGQVDGLEHQLRRMELRFEDADKQVGVVKQEGIEATNLLKAQIEVMEKYGITPERRYLNEVLQKIRRLVENRPHKPKVFISYAWYARGSKELESLQKRLYQLRRDLLTAGVDRVFYDECNMTGNLKKRMREGLAECDVVLLIGTPQLKKRASEGAESGMPANNLQFELGHIAERCRDKHDLLMPVLLDGQIDTSFPNKIRCEDFAVTIFNNLIREVDSTNDLAYGLTLVGTRPLGIIPAMFGFSDADDQYQDCLDKVGRGRGTYL